MWQDYLIPVGAAYDNSRVNYDRGHAHAPVTTAVNQPAQKLTNALRAAPARIYDVICR